MIEEISRNNVFDPGVQEVKNSNDESKLKEAFLSLLEGIIGMVPNQNMDKDIINTLPKIDVPDDVKRDFEEKNFEKENLDKSSHLKSKDQQVVSKDQQVKESSAKVEKRSETEDNKKTQDMTANKENKNLEADKLAKDKITDQNNSKLSDDQLKSQNDVMSSDVKKETVVTNESANTNKTDKKIETQAGNSNNEVFSTEDQKMAGNYNTQQNHDKSSNKEKTGFKEQNPLNSDNKTKYLDEKYEFDPADSDEKLLNKVMSNFVKEETTGPAKISKSEAVANLKSSAQQNNPLMIQINGDESGLRSQMNSVLAAKDSIDQLSTFNKDTVSKAFSKQTAGLKNSLSPSQQKYVDKVKEVLEKATLTKSSDSISVKIDPPHLGEITVKVVQKGKEVFAKLIPDSKEVEQTLKTKSNELASVLQSLGFKPDDVHVSIGSNMQDFGMFMSAHYKREQGNAGSNAGKRRFRNNGRNGDGDVDATLKSFPTQKSSDLVENGWVA